MDNNRGGGWKQGREVGMAGVVGRDEGKRQKTVLEQLVFKKELTS